MYGVLDNAFVFHVTVPCDLTINYIIYLADHDSTATSNAVALNYFRAENKSTYVKYIYSTVL